MGSTIRDVARIAGVGTGTVSRVLNNSPNVDTQTRANVLKVIADLDFHPSTLARRLSVGRALSVAVIVPFMTRPSVVERLRGIEGALSTMGYDLVVFNVETLERRNKVIEDLTRGDRVDGLLIVGVSPSDDEAIRLTRIGLATVLIDAQHPRLSRVVGHDLRGGWLAAAHLLELGHRRIAFLGELPRIAFNLPASRLRHRGMLAAMRCAGFDLPVEYRVIGEQGKTRAKELAHALLARSNRPTGIVCASDSQAFGAIEAARDIGLSIPRDVSIVGYDDLELASHLGLTTIQQPLFESGMQGARLLQQQMAGGDRRAARHVLDVRLIARATTGPAPA